MNNTPSTPSEQERLFREWMRAQVNDSGMRRYTDNLIIAYAYALRTACHKMLPPIAGNLFAITDANEYDKIYQKLIVAPDYDTVNRENGNGTFGVALRLYMNYLKEGFVHENPGISVSFAAGNNTANTQGSAPGVAPGIAPAIAPGATPAFAQIAAPTRQGAGDDREQLYSEVAMKPTQAIFYGAPGTGKSYHVSKILEEAYPDKAKRDRHIKRMIFHPTYTYEDFVGSIKPLVSLDRPLDYFYSAGPFAVLLKEAFIYPAEKFYLIIEEINRGNSPAIFGDLFQLLDRQEDGKSRYSIMNVDVANYLARDPGLKKTFSDGRIWLPANFNIIATMNTADENIFVLDSAFKRRFSLEYVPIEFGHVPDEWKVEYEVFQGTTPLEALFAGTPLESEVMALKAAGTLKRNWPTFAKLANTLIDIVNKQNIDNRAPETAKIAENKKLGPFFISAEDLAKPNMFINKVIFYLKQDVFTYSYHYMTDSFEQIYIKYLENKGDIFELLR